MLAFDLTNENSFKNVKGWLASIYKQCPTKLPKLLCGNKSDLISQDFSHVNDDEARKISEEHEMEYFKTSAFTGSNVNEMFGNIINQVYDNKIKPQILSE